MTSSSNITFIILTQSNDFHQQEAENLKINITNQFKQFEQVNRFLLFYVIDISEKK